MKLTKLLTVNLFAADATSIAEKFTQLLSELWVPLLSIAGSLAVVWGFYLAWQFWSSSGDEQKRTAAKKSVVSFLIGLFVIFAVAALTPLVIAWLQTWVNG